MAGKWFEIWRDSCFPKKKFDENSQKPRAECWKLLESNQPIRIRISGLPIKGGECERVSECESVREMNRRMLYFLEMIEFEIQ